MTSNQLPDANGRRKARLAAFLRRVPFVVTLGSRLWRLRVPHFTAGVVGVVVNDAGRILLLEHVFHAEHPWGLPGGWLDRRENPDDALVRELREETGLAVAVERHLLARVHPHQVHLDFAYLCRPHGEVCHLNLSREILSYAWVAPPDLPPLYPFHAAAVNTAFPEINVLVHEHECTGHARSSHEL